MKNLIPKRQQEKAFFGLVVIVLLTYMVMITNILYSIEIPRKWILAPLVTYILLCLIVLMYYRLLNWWQMLTFWFDRKSEDEKEN